MTAIPPPADAYPEKSQATVALVLSVVELCCGVLAVAGLILANAEKQAIAAGRRNPSTQGTAQAAFVIGIIGATLWVLGLIAQYTILPGIMDGLELR